MKPNLTKYAVLPGILLHFFGQHPEGNKLLVAKRDCSHGCSSEMRAVYATSHM